GSEPGGPTATTAPRAGEGRSVDRREAHGSGAARRSDLDRRAGRSLRAGLARRTEAADRGLPGRRGRTAPHAVAGGVAAGRAPTGPRGGGATGGGGVPATVPGPRQGGRDRLRRRRDDPGGAGGAAAGGSGRSRPDAGPAGP